MSLSDFQPETITVSHRRITLELRGLSFVDISSLMRTHMNDLETLFDMYEQEANNISFGNVAMARYVTRLVSDAPALVSHIIALAADEPEMVNKAAKLPLTLQLDSLKAIGKLTFEEVGGVKKLLEMLNDLVAEVRPGLPSSNPEGKS